jgi:hypothetical protein
MLDAVARIRSAIGDKALGSLSKAEKSAVLVQLQTLTENASKRMLKYLPNLQAALRRRVTSLPNDKIDMTLVQHLLPDIMRANPNASQDQIIEAVKNKLADTLVEAHKYADEQITSDPQGEALKTEILRKDFVRKNPAPVGWQETTRRTLSKKGEPGVSYSYSPAWLVYAKNAFKTAGKKWTNAEIDAWVKDLSDDDFAADIHAFFLPKFLKDIDLRFEKGNVKGGYDYSNLYAFAMNFKNIIPKQYAERLEEEIMHSPKMSGFYDQINEDKSLTPEQKKQLSLSVVRKQSLAMWNHVDNFLNSGHFPKETHIYRSTQSDMNDPTIWQKQLFNEREAYENKIIDSMFKKDTDANRNARSVIKVLMARRRQAFKQGEQQQFKMISEFIKERLTRPGPRGGKSPAEGKLHEPTGTTLKTARGDYKLDRVIHAEPMATMFKSAADIQAYRDYQAKDRVLRDRYEELSKIRDEKFNETLKNLRDAKKEAAYKAAKAAYNAAWDELQAHQESTAPDVKYMGLSPEAKHGPGGVVFEDDNKRTTVYLKGPFMDAYHHATNPIGSFGSKLYGQNISSHVDELRDLLTRFDQKLGHYTPDVKTGLKRLFIEAYRNAGPTGVNVIRAGEKEATAQETYAEEWTHGWQRYLAERRTGKITPDAVLGFLDAEGFQRLHIKTPKAMKDFLDTHYASRHPIVKVLEATAKLITQPPEKFGVSQNEADDFIFETFKEVHRVHGADAFEHLTDAIGVAKALRDAYRGK